MKWNIIVGSMVLGLGLCTQSFGFDLLDRMLGVNGCGCDGGAKSCCEAGPSCAAPAGCASKGGCDDGCGRGRCCAKKCDPCATKRCCHRDRCGKGCGNGCANGCANKGCAAPAPSCAAPSCAAPAPTCAAPSCAAPAPTCGAAAPSCGCDNGHKHCGSKCCKQICRQGLLDRLFSCHRGCDSCDKGCTKGGCTNGCANKGCAAPAPTCAAPACGCDGGAAPAPVKGDGDMAPTPPAPVVDPSAYLQTTQRRVVQASTSLVR